MLFETEKAVPTILMPTYGSEIVYGDLETGTCSNCLIV